MSVAKNGKKPRKVAAGELSEAERRKNVRELRGKYASALPDVDEFLRVKHAEVEAGEAEWGKIRSERRASRGSVGDEIMTKMASARKKTSGRRARATPIKVARPMTHAERVQSILGKYAFVRFTSEDYAQEKAREIEREG